MINTKFGSSNLKAAVCLPCAECAMQVYNYSAAGYTKIVRSEVKNNAAVARLIQTARAEFAVENLTPAHFSLRFIKFHSLDTFHPFQFIQNNTSRVHYYLKGEKLTTNLVSLGSCRTGCSGCYCWLGCCTVEVRVGMSSQASFALEKRSGKTLNVRLLRTRNETLVHRLC